jgi:hypothetical protein
MTASAIGNSKIPVMFQHRYAATCHRRQPEIQSPYDTHFGWRYWNTGITMVGDRIIRVNMTINTPPFGHGSTRVQSHEKHTGIRNSNVVWFTISTEGHHGPPLAAGTMISQPRGAILGVYTQWARSSNDYDNHCRVDAAMLSSSEFQRILQVAQGFRSSSPL